MLVIIYASVLTPESFARHQFLLVSPRVENKDLLTACLGCRRFGVYLEFQG